MPTSIRSRLLLLLTLSVLLPALAGVLWVVAVAAPGPTPASVMPWLVGGALPLLGLAVGGALWLSHRITQAERSALEARAKLERQLEAATQRSGEAERRALQAQRFEALGRLTGAVAHDVNNLLGVISNSAYLIERRSQQQPELQQPLAATMRAVEAGRRLSQHLQRLAGRPAGRPEQVDLAASLPEMRDVLAVVLGKRIAIELEVAPDTCRIVVDPGELELALINLAFDARDALQEPGPEGGHVRLETRNARPHELSNAPPDEPGGQPAGPCVLMRFAHDGNAVGNDGGNGLAQVQSFCAAAGGRARIDATPGRGTTVSLILPAAVAANGREAASRPIPPTPQA